MTILEKQSFWKDLSYLIPGLVRMWGHPWFADLGDYELSHSPRKDDTFNLIQGLVSINAYFRCRLDLRDTDIFIICPDLGT